MPKQAKELTALEVRKLIKPGRHAVGGVKGLLINVTDSGSKNWVLRTMMGSKRAEIGLGGFPEVGLAQAREDAAELKQMIQNGINPIHQRKANQKKLQDAIERTFEKAAESYIKGKQSEWTNAKHAMNWRNSLYTHVLPLIGRVPITDITRDHVIKVLEPIWDEKKETATRVRQRIEKVLDWAKAEGWRTGDNPAAWKGNLENRFSKRNKAVEVQHFEAMPAPELYDFMKSLRQMDTIAAKCLDFVILTASRSGMARGAVWSEFDLQRRLWTVPAERMKSRKEFRCALSDDAVRLIQSIPRFEGEELLFPSPTRRGKPLSDMTLTKLLRDKGLTYTPHGFRSTFRDWAAELTRYPSDMAEMALAHKIRNEVEAAYRRGDMFQKRVKMMNDWAAFCRTEYKKAAGGIIHLDSPKAASIRD